MAVSRGKQRENKSEEYYKNDLIIYNPEVVPFCELKPEHQVFVQKFVDCGNAGEAAIAAGYCKTHGAQLKTQLAKYIKTVQAEALLSQACADKQEVLFRLSEMVRGRTSDTQVVVVMTGSGYSEPRVVEKPMSNRDQIAAAKLYAQMIGLLTPAPPVQPPINIIFDRSEIIDEDAK